MALSYSLLASHCSQQASYSAQGQKRQYGLNTAGVMGSKSSMD